LPGAIESTQARAACASVILSAPANCSSHIASTS
jgi:hypothetical protein